MIIIAGPTATGKTSLGIRVSRELNGEVISADSRQVYRKLKAGTAKPEGGWKTTKNGRFYFSGGIIHHMVDFLKPAAGFNAGLFAREAGSRIRDAVRRGSVPVVAGGTGLYIRALLDGLTELPEKEPSIRDKLASMSALHGRKALHDRLKEIDPVSAASIPQGNIQRIIRAIEVYEVTGVPISMHHRTAKTVKPPGDGRPDIFFALTMDRDELYERIDERTDTMLKNGMIEETSALLDSGISRTAPALNSLGYRHVISYLSEEISYGKMKENISKDTRHYAKRQITWFRKDSRINWINMSRTPGENALRDIITKWKESSR